MWELYLNSLDGALRISLHVVYLLSLCCSFVAAHWGFGWYRCYISLTNQPFCLESQHGR